MTGSDWSRLLGIGQQVVIGGEGVGKGVTFWLQCVNVVGGEIDFDPGFLLIP